MEVIWSRVNMAKFKGFLVVVNTFLKGSSIFTGMECAGYLDRSSREIRQDSFSKRCFRMGGIYVSIVVF
jgi:hypothetical protein